MHTTRILAAINAFNGLAIVAAVVILMAPLPLVPFANTLPAIGILLLSLGIAERDGVLLLGGYGVTLLSALYVGSLMYLVIEAGSDPQAALDALSGAVRRVLGH